MAVPSRDSSTLVMSPVGNPSACPVAMRVLFLSKRKRSPWSFPAAHRPFPGASERLVIPEHEVKSEVIFPDREYVRSFPVPVAAKIRPKSEL